MPGVVLILGFSVCWFAVPHAVRRHRIYTGFVQLSLSLNTFSSGHTYKECFIYFFIISAEGVSMIIYTGFVELTLFLNAFLWACLKGFFFSWVFCKILYIVLVQLTLFLNTFSSGYILQECFIYLFIFKLRKSIW